MTINSPAFTKVLVANRGEIACRIIRALSEMGIASVAIYHISERRARHVTMADEAFEISGDTPVAAHLDGEQIVALAVQSEAAAIHPGYGFLSENAGFARRVLAAKLAFIGPDPETIELMGDKIASRQFAATHGIPVAPSVMPTGDLAAFTAAAEKIGFPILIKASAGGGGKGMSIVRSAAEVADRAAIAASEAERYFSDNRIYAERYIDQPRHIEVQVFGDGEGGALHLYERECSIQRRFQKIVEEAPAANLPESLRAEICDAAVRLTKAARYRNAGTVEFILAPDGSFYFLEMNTRLQVEHPVTEAVTGLDLVQMQIMAAAGHPLPLKQEDITVSGHAIECRICAEDPEQDFFPETGAVLAMTPPHSSRIRLDHGLAEGQAVTSNFDSMLAKLITHGDSREAAIELSIAALQELTLLGVVTNIDYLARLIDHPDFRAGRIHTGFVTEHAADLALPSAALEDRDAAIIAAALSSREFRALAFDIPEPYASIGGWRN
ncbi:MAG: biotin carboxylase [Sneathiella sp.]|uniref:acetyl-CoA carboxylase biotin carboxylase subunit n=1 Tax=Sneathiella sp. TaxID=1964365 RepID=UPI000C4AD016|nr:biotin carboxylase N-terminal domain-containing protein [Sneathiella sp.]MAL78803.1 biotin carboxylase [Sneathiella sp.]|tara:strand:+ start:13996 stop:15486 length:1491 start_codon:yes stop_codon:yes gene_type:complete